MKINMNELSIIVPVYNEESTLLELLNKLKKLNKICDLEIIIVNDGSNDKSKNIINSNSELYDKFIHLNKNYGKGKAVIEGLKICSYEYVLIQDADLEYDPEDIKILLEENKKYNYDLIMGSRFIGSKRTVLNFWHMV